MQGIGRGKIDGVAAGWTIECNDEDPFATLAGNTSGQGSLPNLSYAALRFSLAPKHAKSRCDALAESGAAT